MTGGQMNWDDLRIFLAVAREGSLSAAARALKVTQPTIGRRLKGLEEALRTRLFDRLPEGFVPTEAGIELRPLAEAMERDALAVDRQRAAFTQEARGVVRISVWETFAQFLTDHLTELRTRLPEIEIELSVTHILADLMRREADLLIRECLPKNPGLVARKLGRYSHAIYGARDYVEVHPAALGETRYRDCAWVGYDEDHAYFLNQTWLLSRLEGRLPAVRVNNGIVLHEAVRKGVGLGVLPCFAGDRDPALQRLSPPLEDITRDLHLVMHQDLRRSPAVRAVSEALLNIFKDEAERLSGRARVAA
ncbi:MAG: LysR family transcriptional regulator [Alphaproteobacteria bacterium]